MLYFIQILIILLFYSKIVLNVLTKPNIFEATFCEGEIAIISCHENNSISILLANYGRFSVSVCNLSADITLDIYCFNNETLNILRNKCEGKNECDIPVENTVFGDHCSDTPKYLEVQYMCLPVPDTSSPEFCNCTIEEHRLNNQDELFCSKYQNDGIVFIIILLLVAGIGGALLGMIFLYIFIKRYYMITKKSEVIQRRQNNQKRSHEKVHLQMTKNLDEKESPNDYDEIL